MGKESKIQWTDATYNPWHGCIKVSSGCKYCYMFRDKERYGQPTDVVLKSKSGFHTPLKWKEPKLIFTCSWSDFFIEEADKWREAVWKIIKATPQHTYQILTKRPERIEACLPSDWGDGYENVWLGISAEDQDTYDERYWELSNVPAKLKFLSIEPLLGDIALVGDVDQWYGWGNYIDWVIVGGESGNETGNYKYRKCRIEWMNYIVEQCQGEDVPVFVKQLGTHLAKGHGLKDRHGGDVNEFPTNLKVRQMPKGHGHMSGV